MVMSNYCNNNVWLAITDHQNEGNFLNVSKFSYNNVFLDHQSQVGEQLMEERWQENEPNGGTVENCVAKDINQKNQGKSWWDIGCGAKLCVACSIRANKQFQLRGLCRRTL